MDLIDRQAAIEALENTKRSDPFDRYENQNIGIEWAIDALRALPAAQPTKRTAERTETHACDCISRQAAIEAIMGLPTWWADEGGYYGGAQPPMEALLDPEDAVSAIENLPSAQPEKEIAKRVLWSGWKGTRNTRYKCPMCKKPVKNDDVYCHRCGQKLMFPHISFTDYVPGEKQETIVRWDDE